MVNSRMIVKLAKLVILFIAAVGLWACGAANGPIRKVDFNQLAPALEARSNLVNQFRAEFTKTKSSALFKRALTVNGSLLFQKPGMFRLVLTGDVNAEILSNGKFVTIIHDGSDKEFYFIHGERDSSKMSDPLMALLQELGSGGLRKFTLTKEVNSPSGLDLELIPSSEAQFERVRTVNLALSDSGDIEKVVVFFENGAVDETEFKSWSLLTADDPAIVELHEKLDHLAAAAADRKDYRAEDGVVGKYSLLRD
jgi:outer membrane lipoprotein-sorting protein